MKSCCHASSLETQKESVQECSPDLPSTPPFGYILGPDSPPMDEPCRGTLRLTGQQIHTAVFVTQADILTSAMSTSIFMVASLLAERSPTIQNLFFSLTCVWVSNKSPERMIRIHSFGRILSPGHFRRKSARPMSCYALVQGWLLLGKPFGCLSTPTSFATEYSFWGLN